MCQNQQKQEDLFGIVENCSAQAKQQMLKMLDQLSPTISIGNSENSQKCQLEEIFQKITHSFRIEESREISKGERKNRELHGYQFNYGQVSFSVIFQIFQSIKQYWHPTNSDIFYDLGSGTGKVLLAASICHPFKKCIGIQVLESLYNRSLVLQKKIMNDNQTINEIVSHYKKIGGQFPEIEIINKNFKQYDWNDGTVTFVSSTCFSGELMKQVEKLSKKMKVNSIMVTLNRKLQQIQQCWKVKTIIKGKTSWGATTAFIQIKIK